MERLQAAWTAVFELGWLALATWLHTKATMTDSGSKKISNAQCCSQEVLRSVVQTVVTPQRQMMQ
jgi:hypothetical protein